MRHEFSRTYWSIILQLLIEKGRMPVIRLSEQKLACGQESAA
jgi:hypothetical protein